MEVEFRSCLNRVQQDRCESFNPDYDPAKHIIGVKRLTSILLDPIQARAKFNFREQTKIYDKAERVLKKKFEEKSNLEKMFASNEATVKFLEGLMDSFDSESGKTETK